MTDIVTAATTALEVIFNRMKPPFAGRLSPGHRQRAARERLSFGLDHRQAW
jgi:hypothetical protein